MPTLDEEFRRNHRAASESLIAAAEADNRADIDRALDNSTRFEQRAMRHIETPRQRALAMGLLHAADLMRAVTDAEFQR